MYSQLAPTVAPLAAARPRLRPSGVTPDPAPRPVRDLELYMVNEVY